MDTLVPLVSVIVPAYNCERYIGEALRSALNQDYPNKEIIVINDGSTDGTASVLAAFGGNVTVVDQPNSGAAVARNAALQLASGKYVAFLDSDDLWLPSKLRVQVTYLEKHPDIGMVYSAWREWRPDTDGTFRLPNLHDEAREFELDDANSGWLYNKLLLDCVVHTTTVLLRADVAARVGQFDASLRRGQDYDYWLRVSRLTPIHKLRNVFSLYRIHGESISFAPHRLNYAYLVIRRAIDRWGPIGPDGTVTDRRTLNHILARHWFDFGYVHRESGDLRLACHAFWQCIRYRPFWRAAWLSLARSCLRLARQAVQLSPSVAR